MWDSTGENRHGQRTGHAAGDARSRAARGQPVPRLEPQGRLAAGVRRPGGRPGAGRGTAHRRGERSIHSLHGYFIRPGDPAGADHLRGGARSRRQELHHQAGDRHPAWRADLLHARPPFMPPKTASSTRCRCPRCPSPEDLPGERELLARLRRAHARKHAPLLRARPADRTAPLRSRSLSRSGEERARSRQDVWFRATGEASRRSARSINACSPMPPT